MSVGPAEQKEEGSSRFERVRAEGKQIVKDYFKDPIRYLFYGTLIITIIGLAAGQDFNWKFYAILAALGAIEIYKNLHQNDGEPAAK